MGILPQSAKYSVPRLDFELTPACDHKCGHCYNVWTASEGDPQAGYQKGQLRTDEFLAMMEKAVRQSGAEQITITGGEPLLRKDALTIVDKACELTSQVQLITNGSHVPSETADRLAKAKVYSVQLTLLSAEPARHNELKGADCFDDTLRAALNLRDAGVMVQLCFVATQKNWRDFREVMELCLVLGIRSISYNRMAPTGRAIHHIEQLMPQVDHIEANLDTAEELGKKWGIHVATAMPIPPCLIRIERYEWVKFGFCSTGTSSPNIVIDALGNVRSCNLASGIMGNIVRQNWQQIFSDPYQREFQQKVPEMCRGCAYENSCQGGCKESGFATFGDHAHPEPLVYLATKNARTGRRALPVVQVRAGGPKG